MDSWNSKHLIHDIYLEWEYQPERQHVTIGSWNCGIGGNEPISDNGVFAVGYDSDFIIAKSHPVDTSSSNSSRLDKSKTLYYLMDIKGYPEQWQTSKNVTVYENLDSFRKACRQAGVSKHLDFNVITRELQ